MNKIDEILNKYRDITRWPEYPEITEDEYIQAMKEYAEYYAKKCLEIAAKEACLNEPKLDYRPSISKLSITDIQLPDHDSI